MSKFIKHAALISEKKSDIILLLLTLAAVKKVGRTGGVY